MITTRNGFFSNNNDNNSSALNIDIAHEPIEIITLYSEYIEMKKHLHGARDRCLNIYNNFLESEEFKAFLQLVKTSDTKTDFRQFYPLFSALAKQALLTRLLINEYIKSNKMDITLIENTNELWEFLENNGENEIIEYQHLVRIATTLQYAPEKIRESFIDTQAELTNIFLKAIEDIRKDSIQQTNKSICTLL